MLIFAAVCFAAQVFFIYALLRFARESKRRPKRAVQQPLSRRIETPRIALPPGAPKRGQDHYVGRLTTAVWQDGAWFDPDTIGTSPRGQAATGKD